MNGVVIAETVRRHITNVGYVSYLILIAIISLGMSRFNKPGAGWPSMVAVLAIVVGSAPIGPEFSSGTLQLILVKPIRRWVYLLSRVAGVVLCVWIAAFIGGMVELIARMAWGNAATTYILGAMLNSFADAVLTASLLVLLGSVTRAYFNVAIYLGTEVGLTALATILGFLRATRSALGQFLAGALWIERGVMRISDVLFPEFPPRFDPHWLLLVLSEAAVALALACLAFRRREVPYGAD